MNKAKKTANPLASSFFKKLFFLIFFTLLHGVLFSLVNASEATSSSALWQEYSKNPDTHPNIPNCSYAGYHYGEDPLPNPTGPIFDVKKYGAKGDGKSDDTEAFRATLAAVDDKGGVVLIPNGKYLISGVLFVHTSRTVIRGESREKTEIVFTKPLNQAYAPANYQGKDVDIIASRWSYSGGLIWFGPRSMNTYLSPEKVGLQLEPNANGIMAPNAWQTVGEAVKVPSIAKRGDFKINLEKPITNLKSGDFIQIQLHNTPDYSLLKHLSGGKTWAEQFDWKNAPRGGAWPNYSSASTLIWVVEVTKNLGKEITLRQPLRFDIRPEWTPTAKLLASPVRESGIENLTLRFMRDYEWKEKATHHKEQGWNAPFFNNSVHCWMHGVTMYDMDNGPSIAASKCVTITDFTLKSSGEKLSSHHHGTIARVSSCDNLFSNFTIESAPCHGLNVESFSSGNVWSKGTLVHGVFDTHRKMPFENIRTDITLVHNDGFHGGSNGPVMGARFVHWNIRIKSGNEYIAGWGNSMPQGAIVGLQGAKIIWNAEQEQTPLGELSGCRIESPAQSPNPSNLYEAQLSLRLKKSK